MAPDHGSPPEPPPPFPPPTGPPLPGPPDPPGEAERRVALVFGVLAEAALIWWLASMAWSESVDEPALSLGDGLAAVVVFWAMATACIAAGAVAYATGRRPAGAIAGVVLLGVGGVVGFVGGLVTAMARVDSGDH